MTRPSSRRRLAHAATIAASLGCTRVALGQCAYSYEVFPIPAGWSSTSPFELRDDGTVVGAFKYPGQIASHAFRWRADTGFEVLTGPPGVSDKRAIAIAANGLIAGDGHAAGTPPDSTQLVIWYDGTSSWVPNLGGGLYVSVDDAAGDGYVVGHYSVSGGTLPFIWHDGAFVPLPPEIASMYGCVLGINESLGITGYHVDYARRIPQHAFVGSLSHIVDLPDIEGVFNPEPYDVTRSGHCALTAYTATYLRRGYFWNGSSFEFIGLLPTATYSRAFDINEVDQIVGESGVPSSTNRRGVLWQSGHLYDMNSLAVLPPGATIKSCSKISDDGTILATTPLQPSGAIDCILRPMTLDAADVTLDCRVNADDLMCVLGNWGPRAQAFVPRADLDGDGMIGPSDLAIVLGAWTP
ncbi:MAG: hypothetical protein U0572_03435 [Phycisphaerales bacterium]